MKASSGSLQPLSYRVFQSIESPTLRNESSKESYHSICLNDFDEPKTLRLLLGFATITISRVDSLHSLNKVTKSRNYSFIVTL